jgi:altronate dehydratase
MKRREFLTSAAVAGFGGIIVVGLEQPKANEVVADTISQDSGKGVAVYSFRACNGGPSARP